MRGLESWEDAFAAVSRIKLPHIVLAGLIVSACVVGGLDSYEQRHVRPGAMEESDWAGRTKITYWEKWSGFEFQAIRDAVDEYNSTQGAADRIYVDLINTSQVNVKTMIFTAGGQPPDLAAVLETLQNEVNR